MTAMILRIAGRTSCSRNGFYRVITNAKDFLGWSGFPFKELKKEKYHGQNWESIRESIPSFFVQKRRRVMRPDFGCGSKNLYFRKMIHQQHLLLSIMLRSAEKMGTEMSYECGCTKLYRVSVELFYIRYWYSTDSLSFRRSITFNNSILGSHFSALLHIIDNKDAVDESFPKIQVLWAASEIRTHDPSPLLYEEWWVRFPYGFFIFWPWYFSFFSP